MSESIKQSEKAPFGPEYGPLLMGPFAPVTVESTLTDLEVIGTIPPDLNGAYLRNGPNPHFAPIGRYHAFDGDGMVHSALFENGSVTYRNRWVRTTAWQEEDAAGQSIYKGIMDTLKGREDQPLKNTANTDVVWHAGVAVASWYMAGDPYRLDPITLETLGKAPYVGLGGGFSAHCKVDAHTGEMMFFDYWNEAPYMSYGVVNAQGKLVHQVPIELAGPRLPHDMAITENFSILHDLPLIHCPDALKNKRHKLKFEPSMPTRLGVIPRFGGATEIRWFEFSPCFIYHTVNAWEDGDEVVMVGCRFMPQRFESGEIDAQATANDIAQLCMTARLWVWRMNMRTGEAREQALNMDHNVEFPGMNLAYQGRKSRWAYLVDHDPKTLHWTGLRKFDLDSGECTDAWTDDPVDAWYSEPWFAPRDGAKHEDDGYVVLFCWNQAAQTQELQVFDACTISTGPVARIRLPQHVPAGFHACWVSAEQLALTA